MRPGVGSSCRVTSSSRLCASCRAISVLNLNCVLTTINSSSKIPRTRYKCSSGNAQKFLLSKQMWVIILCVRSFPPCLLASKSKQEGALDKAILIGSVESCSTGTRFSMRKSLCDSLPPSLWQVPVNPQPPSQQGLGNRTTGSQKLN